MPLVGTKVRVHLNLHRHRAGLADAWCITVKGRVVANVATVCIRDVKPVFNRNKQAFTASGNKRTVHAWLEGYLCPAPKGERTEITYNPHRTCEFTTRDGCEISGASFVVFTSDHRAWTME